MTDGLAVVAAVPFVNVAALENGDDAVAVPEAVAPPFNDWNGDDVLLEVLELEDAAAKGFPPADCDPKIPGLLSLLFPVLVAPNELDPPANDANPVPDENPAPALSLLSATFPNGELVEPVVLVAAFPKALLPNPLEPNAELPDVAAEPKGDAEALLLVVALVAAEAALFPNPELPKVEPPKPELPKPELPKAEGPLVDVAAEPKGLDILDAAPILAPALPKGELEAAALLPPNPLLPKAP